MLSHFQKGFPKIYADAKTAVSDIPDSCTIISSGFGLCGIPFDLLEAIRDSAVKDLHVVSSNAGTDHAGVGLLLENGQVRRCTASYVGENRQMEQDYIDGKLEINFTPQGTLAEKLRCGGAGIPGFFTATGVHTLVADGGIPIRNQGKLGPAIYSEPKLVQSMDLGGYGIYKDYVFEESITGDYSLIRASKVDTQGNCQFNYTTMNFNPDVAKSSRITIVEAEEIVQLGEIEPDQIHLAGIYVDRIVQAKPRVKPIEKPVTQESFRSNKKFTEGKKTIARRVASLLRPGMYVNLGIGLPTMAVSYMESNSHVRFQSENGIMGMGKYPADDTGLNPDLINAGKESVTLEPGASTFSSSESFSIIRGSHLDMTVLGGLEVDQEGNLANWIIPGKMVKGMGGAMDLVAGDEKVVVCMEHISKGKKKVLKRCNLPLTGRAVIDILVTDLALFEFKHGKMYLREISDKITLDELKSKTEAEFVIEEGKLHSLEDNSSHVIFG